MPPAAGLDPLTGAHSRAVFQRRLLRELKRAQRAAAPLALALIDLDHLRAGGRGLSLAQLAEQSAA